MGNCVGNSSKTEDKPASTAAKVKDPKIAIIQQRNEEQLVVKLLVEVNTLSSDDGPLRWQPLFHSLIPVSLHCIQEGSVYVYRLSGAGVTGTSFSVDIKVPGTKMRKTSECFVQWRDDENDGAWGLNFMSETDAIQFLNGCSPPTLTPMSERLRHTFSTLSLSLPIPEPPTNTSTNTDNTNHHPNNSITTNEGPVSPQPDLEVQTLEVSIETSNDEVSVFSYSSREDDDDGDLPELFQPTAPFQGGQTFILPDIMEENDEEIDSENETLDTQNLDEGFEAAGLDIDNDIAETNFADEVVERTSYDESTKTPEEVIPGPFEAPILPNSPPPGPLLSPRLSMQLAEGRVTDRDSSRFSTVSFSDDVPPPPLPSSLPPGKLISPRSSLYQDRSSFIIDEHQPSSLELVSSRIESLKEETEDDHTKQKQILSGAAPVVDETDGIDPILVLAPPIAALEETDYVSVNRRHSIYFDPPLQFQAGSDSGFPDTDGMPAGHSDQSTNGGNHGAMLDVVDMGTKSEGLLKPFESSRHKDSSTTTTSYTEERMTEYSESVDMKTNVSSTSQHSLSEAEETTITGKKSGTIVDQGGKEMQAQAVSLEQETLKPTIRKTGWVELKQMLICKNKKVAMSAKRKWKKYWATLKGCSLLLYQCDEQSTLSETARVDLRIDVELCLAQAVHDHVKRDHIFCLSTSNGKSYYIQTTNQSEVEDWITVIHCSAATALTSQPHKVEAVKNLKNQVMELNKMIEKETQLRNMTELNMSAPLTDSTGRTMAAEQVVACSENIERYNVELYRIRCYISSMEGTELPNPQSLLGSISKPTKLALGRVGTFSVSSLHAMVSARHSVGPSASSNSLFNGSKFSLSSNLSKSRRSSKEKAATLPRTPDRPRKLRTLDISYPLPKLPANVATQYKMNGSNKTSKRRLEISYPYPKISQSSPSGSTRETSPRETIAFSPVSDTTLDDSFPAMEAGGMPLWPSPFLNEAVFQLPGGETTQLTLRNDMTVIEVLSTVCEKHHLDAADHFVMLTVMNHNTDFVDVIPNINTLFVDLVYQSVAICQKSIRTVNLVKTDNDRKNFGLSLSPQWSEDWYSDLVRVAVAAVSEGSPADDGGIIAGDEIMLVNESSVVELGWDGVEKIINSAASVSLTLRYMAQNSSSYSFSSHHILEGLICPAPPSRQRELTGDTLQNLIVPKPNDDDEASLEHSSFHGLSQNQIDLLLKDSKELSKLVRGWERRGSLDDSTSPWTKEDKLRKSAKDLVETEADYVMLLGKLVDRYLEPLKSESFLSQADVTSLTGNIIKIVELQKAFLKCLQDSLGLELVKPKTPHGESPLKHVAHGIAGAFLSHVDHFREYSTFCASHQKLKSILASRGDNEQLQEFLEVRNPNFETSLNLEQLLIKPIVRISRYPLFLDAMIKYTEPERDERAHLKEALECMEGLAKYINDAQRLCETYYLLFEEMMIKSGYSELGVSVHISQLMYHGEVLWLNPTDEQLARGWKKGQGPATLCFVFKSAIIMICLDKKTKRKESKGPRELSVTADDIRYKLLLPAVYCGVQDLPDSDGVTNMWQVQCRRKHDHGFKRYLFRSQNIEEKLKMIDFIQQSIVEQQRIYGGSPNIFSRSSFSSATGRSSPASLISFSHSPYRLRVTSPTPSQLSLPAFSVTTTDTDQD